MNKINIYESPILALSTTEEKTVYLILDTGATASLISLTKAKSLGLQILKTQHRAVQVDGESDLKVVGEVHTSLFRETKQLTFQALVVDNMAVDILAGTNFHVDNDVSARMAKGTITIGSMTVESTSPTILELDKCDTRQRLVRNPNRVDIMPGDTASFSIPVDLPPDAHLQIEANLQQVKTDFFKPTIVQAKNGHIKVENETDQPISLKKVPNPLM